MCYRKITNEIAGGVKMSLSQHFVKDGVDVYVYDTFEKMGKAAADFAAQIIQKLAAQQEEINLLLPIASSQYSFLPALCSMDLPWEKINFFHVDEYIGLAADDKRTLRNELLNNFIGKLPYRGAYFMDGLAKDPKAESRRYAALLKAHKTDLSVLGFGDNGHLAFNEPHCANFDDPEPVKIIDIDPVSKKQQIASGYFKDEEDMPDHAFTLTLPTLVSARYKICVVPFPNKAKSSHDALFGPIGEVCPASIIRTVPNVTAFFDKDSAGLFPG